MKHKSVALLAAVLLLAAGSSACRKLKARDELNKGVAAFRQAQFQAAINHFQEAVKNDPGLLNAQLYLATAFSQLYIPGGDSPDNIKLAKQAIQEYEKVLQQDPNNITAIASIGLTYYNMKDFDKAKEYQKRRMDLEPNNPEPYYWIGVIDWGVCWPRKMAVRKELKITQPKDPKDANSLPPIPERERVKLAEENGALVEEAIKALDKAIEMKPNDENTYTYLNLMYREKADIESSASARDEDIKKADELQQKALGIRKEQIERAASAVH